MGPRSIWHLFILTYIEIYCSFATTVSQLKISDFLGEAFKTEVCHPRCMFKLYGEVNSVKNTNISIWINDGVY